MTAATRVRLGLFAALAGMVGCDHATKIVAKAELEGRPPELLLGSLLDLRYVENRDIGFNLLSFIPEGLRYPLLVAVGAFAILALGFFVFARLPPAGTLAGARVFGVRVETLAHVGLLLMLGGALGNYLDRVARGYVIDFIHAAHWPVFNVADIWVTFGGVALVLAALRRPPPRPTT